MRYYCTHCIIVLNINLSDHRPICVISSFVFDDEADNDDDDVLQSSSTVFVSQLR